MEEALIKTNTSPHLLPHYVAKSKRSAKQRYIHIRAAD